jgi:hypothetical protein
MNSRTHQRLIRSFVAALLQSDLSASDLIEISNEIVQGSFDYELAEIIRKMAKNLQENYQLSHEDNVRVAYDLLAKRRLSRSVILRLMKLASSQMAPSQLRTSGTVRDLLDKYFSLASHEEISKFMGILQGETDDLYLKGIRGK